MPIDSEILRRYRTEAGLTQPKFAEILDRHPNTVRNAEAGKPTRLTSDYVEACLTAWKGAPVHLPTEAEGGPAGSFRLVPFYRENRDGSLDRFPTDCPDPEAFAFRLADDSMAPSFPRGTVVVATGAEGRSGEVCLVALQAGTFLFRHLQRLPGKVRLTCLNSLYTAMEFPLEDIEWAHPVYTATVALGGQASPP